jgi:acyl-CoA synthetase (AMP-forming)/AMP-acid ligase II
MSSGRTGEGGGEASSEHWGEHRGERDEQPATPVAALARAARLVADGTVAPCGLRFVDRREQERFFDWAELVARARPVAGGLRALGVGRGERVALVYSTCPEFFDAFFGIWLAGAVPVPLYPPVRLGRLDEYHQRTARMIELAGARLVLAEPRIRRLLGQAVAAARPPLGCRTLGDLPAASSIGEDDLTAPPHPDELALVQFSSGTTVDPKPVALSHRAVAAQVRALNSLWPEQSQLEHSGVSWLPLYHDMGLIGCIFPAFDLPATLTLLGPELFVAKPALWLRALGRYRATISPAPNFAYGLCVAKVRDEEMAGVDLSHWRVALNGAEAVAPSVLRAFTERFARWGFRPEALTPVYGLSEAALAVTFSSFEQPFTSRRFDRRALAEQGTAMELPGPERSGAELVSVGRPLPGFELEIRHADTGEPLPQRRVGRVWVRGPSLMDGYLDQPEATAAALVDGWLDTGDLGFLAGGELYLSGRAKELIILRGRNYAPEIVERPLAELAGARPGCAVALSWLPEGADGEVLWLFVETARGATPETLRTLPERCRVAVLAATRLAVDEVHLLAPGTLPRTSSGKLRRGETLRRFLAGELDAPTPATPLRLAGAVARSSLAYARWRWRGSE